MFNRTRTLVIAAVLCLFTVAAADAALWSVDFQGTGSTTFGQDPTPTTMSGVEPLSGLGNVWNGFTVSGFNATPFNAPPISTNPSMSLVDSTGAASPVSFAITGSVWGWDGPTSSPSNSSGLLRDYLFLNPHSSVGNPATSFAWTISGLTPGGEYTFYAYTRGTTSPENGYPIDLTIQGGPATTVDNGMVVFNSIIADGAGLITGVAAIPSGQPEGDWAGFQLLEVTAAVPAPAALPAGLALMLAAAVRRRRSHR